MLPQNLRHATRRRFLKLAAQFSAGAGILAIRGAGALKLRGGHGKHEQLGRVAGALCLCGIRAFHCLYFRIAARASGPGWAASMRSIIQPAEPTNS